MTPLHHMHAALAGAGSKRGAVSADIGQGIRVRLDGGTDDQKREAILRLVLLWNMHDAIPTTELERGAVREFYDSVQVLLEVIKEANAPPATAEAAAAVSKAWESIKLELTADGRRADCPCAEQVAPPKEGNDGSEEATGDPGHGEEIEQGS